MKLSDIPFKQARHFTRGRIRPVQLIVIHSMEAAEKGSTAENVAAYFASTDVKASAHFNVDNNSIVQSVRLEDTAYHCKNANANGIGIEHAGYAKQTGDEWLDTYGRAMLERSAELAAALCERYNIPARQAKFAGKNNPQVIETGFCGHADVPLHGSHWDPGKSFPWDWYLERVRFYLAAPSDIQPGAADVTESPSTQQVQGVQVNAEAPAPVVSSPLDTPIQIVKDSSGKLANWLVSGSVLGAIGGFLKDNATLITVFAIAAVVVGLSIYFVNRYMKVLEAKTAADPTKYNVQFVKKT